MLAMVYITSKENFVVNVNTIWLFNIRKKITLRNYLECCQIKQIENIKEKLMSNMHEIKIDSKKWVKKIRR
jgi:hypothetical protein